MNVPVSKPLTDAAMRDIIARRDPRFDGRFYFGVKTTGIYCRPICPARPKPQNILLFRSASEAEGHGYRPCLRCRPDAAPGSKLLQGTLNTVSRALRLIENGAGEEQDVERLAASLGVTSRHLRRLFEQHLGATPSAIVHTQRLHFAKQALRETSRPVAEIAFASGFASVRRFNEAFKARYRQTPTTFRAAHGVATEEQLTLRLPVRLPYDWETVLVYLGRHAVAGIDLVDGDRYVRFVVNADSFGTVVVTPELAQSRLKVTLTDLPLTLVRPLLAQLRHLFDTDHNPGDLPSAKAITPRGIRVPGAFEPWETAVAVIVGQLVSTAAAKTKLNQLVAALGKPLGSWQGVMVRRFFSPEEAAKAPFEEFGLTRTKAAAIRDLATALLTRAVDFQAHGPFAEAVSGFLAIRGIGPWSASMIAMRCLGDPDAFPAGDLIVQRAVAAKLVDPNDWVLARAYLTHCLWRDYGTQLSNSKSRVYDPQDQPKPVPVSRKRKP